MEDKATSCKVLWARELSSAPHHVSTFCCLDKLGHFYNIWWVSARLSILVHRNEIDVVNFSFHWGFTVNAYIFILNHVVTLLLCAWWTAVTRRGLKKNNNYKTILLCCLRHLNHYQLFCVHGILFHHILKENCSPL